MNAYSVQHRPVVLVVEDEPGLRFVITEFLREDGDLTVVEAACADDAVSYFEGGHHVDVVFSDVRMPGRMDGMALAAWVTHHHPLVKMILTSGNGHPGLAVSFVPKPYDFDHVLALVRSGVGKAGREDFVPPRPDNGARGDSADAGS